MTKNDEFSRFFDKFDREILHFFYQNLAKIPISFDLCTTFKMKKHEKKVIFKKQTKKKKGILIANDRSQKS